MNKDARKILLVMAWRSADLAVGCHRMGLKATAEKAWEASSKMLIEAHKLRGLE